MAEGLQRLLEGTGLSAQPAGAGVYSVLVEAKPEASRDAASTAVSEIVVTAQKRDERAQDVPITLTAFSGAQVDALRINDIQNVSRLTPGLLVSSFSRNSPTIAIRGSNNTFQQIGVNKPVQVSVDDVFLTRSTAYVFELFDLSSIQVLKGPQGTLFGRNVTGGAIVINTRDPVLGRLKADAKAEFGDFGTERVDAYLSLPIGERLAVLGHRRGAFPRRLRRRPAERPADRRPE